VSPASNSYRSVNDHEGLNLIVERERGKSPVEYTLYAQSSATQSNAVPVASTSAEATFAKIAPLLSQGIIHHSNHSHSSIGHASTTQPSQSDRLLMAAPVHHHQKEQTHDVHIRTSSSS
jgi:hypothetical protein